MLLIGSQMPEFVVRDTERQKISTQDFKNTITVIAFYPMAFTGG